MLLLSHPCDLLGVGMEVLGLGLWMTGSVSGVQKSQHEEVTSGKSSYIPAKLVEPNSSPVEKSALPVQVKVKSNYNGQCKCRKNEHINEG